MSNLVESQSLFDMIRTPYYFAPEVLMGHYSEKVDIWSAGVLLHVFLVGAFPFRGGTSMYIFKAIQTDKLNFNVGGMESIFAINTGFA
ncbi:hypothetical protein ACLOJK_029626 [Asimina triloba]